MDKQQESFEETDFESHIRVSQSLTRTLLIIICQVISSLSTQFLNKEHSSLLIFDSNSSTANMKYTAALVAALVSTTSAAATTTLPKSAGATAFPTAVPVKGNYDGGMKRFERDRKPSHS